MVVSDIKDIDIVKVISRFVSLKKVGSGNEWSGLCPFHNETKPSFFVNDKKGVYYCFGCGARGNVITFIKQKLLLSYWEALNFLEREFGFTFTQELLYQKYLLDKKFVLLKKAMEFYHNQLLKHKDILAFIINKRKFKLKTIRSYYMGLALESAPFSLIAKAEGYSDEDLEQAGLISNGKDLFFNRIIIPVITKEGTPIALIGRSLDDEQKPKYLYTKHSFKEDAKLFFNRTYYSNYPLVVVCEGIFDSLKLEEIGIPSIALLGSHCGKDDIEFFKYVRKNVLLALDRDQFESVLRGQIRDNPILSFISNFVAINNQTSLFIYNYIERQGTEPADNPEEFSNFSNYLPFYTFLAMLYKLIPEDYKINFENYISNLYSRITSFTFKNKLIEGFKLFAGIDIRNNPSIKKIDFYYDSLSDKIVSYIIAMKYNPEEVANRIEKEKEKTIIDKVIQAIINNEIDSEDNKLNLLIKIVKNKLSEIDN